MDWGQANRLSSEGENRFVSPKYDMPGSWVHIRYYEAYNILFRFENSLRVLVYSVLKRHKGPDWVNTLVNDSETINSVCKQRIAQNKKYGYLGQNNSSPMLYLNTGELIYILDDENLWQCFNRYFSADRSVIVNKLLEINTVRNSFAHFRPVTDQDIGLLKQNISHVFHQACSYFDDLYSIIEPVPSNCEEAWFKSLVAYQYPSSRLSFHESKSGEFVRVTLFIPTVELDTLLKEDYCQVTITKIKIQKLLQSNKRLLNFVIYVNDLLYLSGEPSGSNRSLTSNSGTSLYFVFSRSNLSRKHEEISSLIFELGNQIEEDLSILKKDSGSSGKFTVAERQYCSTKSDRNVDRYDFSYLTKLWSNESNSDIVEYWGKYVYSFGDSVTEKSSIPWILGEICPISSGF